MKSDDDIVGPQDALSLIVGETGKYALTYDKNLEEAQLTSPIEGSQDLKKVMEKHIDGWFALV